MYFNGLSKQNLFFLIGFLSWSSMIFAGLEDRLLSSLDMTAVPFYPAKSKVNVSLGEGSSPPVVDSRESPISHVDEEFLSGLEEEIKRVFSSPEMDFLDSLSPSPDSLESTPLMPCLSTQAWEGHYDLWNSTLLFIPFPVNPTPAPEEKNPQVACSTVLEGKITVREGEIPEKEVESFFDLIEGYKTEEDAERIEELLRKWPKLIAVRVYTRLTALHVAIKFNKPRLFAFLMGFIRENYTSEQILWLINAPASYGLTPLHVACAMNISSIIQLLLENGANPNALTSKKTKSGRDLGTTPMHELLKCQWWKLRGRRKFDEAQQKLMLETVDFTSDGVKLLLDYNADPRQADGAGYLAISYAKTYKQKKSVKLLEKAIRSAS